MNNVYGYCPQCGGMGMSRERRLNGNDRCENGHSYPSSTAVAKPLLPVVPATEHTADTERAAVVAWLREEAEAAAQTYTLQAGEWANRILSLADDIERGEHRREEDK